MIVETRAQRRRRRRVDRAARGKVSLAGVRLVARFEGYRRHVYLDAAGVPTIGYGETSPALIRKYGRRGIGRVAALALLRRRLNGEYAQAVRDLARRHDLGLTQRMFDALVSFVYNVGPGAIGPNMRVGRHLRAREWRKAAAAMLEWNRADGRVLEGLTRRRKAEAALLLRDVDGAR